MLLNTPWNNLHWDILVWIWSQWKDQVLTSQSMQPTVADSEARKWMVTTSHSASPTGELRDFCVWWAVPPCQADCQIPRWNTRSGTIAVFVVVWLLALLVPIHKPFDSERRRPQRIYCWTFIPTQRMHGSIKAGTFRTLKMHGSIFMCTSSINQALVPFFVPWAEICVVSL